MITVKDIEEILGRILEEAEDSRKMELIKSFQNIVWNKELKVTALACEFLSELAYDLDFYEPNLAVRNEDSSYYSRENLHKLILHAIQKIKELSK